MGTPMDSRNWALTRSQVEPHGSFGPGAGWPCWITHSPQLSPSSGLYRAMPDVSHAGHRGEAVLDLAVEAGQAFNGVACAVRIEVQHVAVAGGDAEVLVLQIGQRFGHQDGAGQQHQRQRRLKDNQGLLRQRRAVARGASRSTPRRASAGCACDDIHAGAAPKSTARDQRNQKCKSKHRQTMGWRRWACCCASGKARARMVCDPA